MSEWTCNKIHNDSARGGGGRGGEGGKEEV